MYAFAIDESSAFAVESDGGGNLIYEDGLPSDELPEPKNWRHYFVDFSPSLRVAQFNTPGGGTVYSAAQNPETGAIWMLARNRLFLLSRNTGEIFHFALPEDKISVFDVMQLGGRFFFSCSFGRVWYYDIYEENWFSLIQSEPFPERQPRRRGETVDAYVKRTTPARVKYIRTYPDFFSGFAVGKDLYFVGDLGRVVRIRGDEMREEHLDSGGSLILGHSEGNQAIISSVAPVAEIFLGTIEDGFERIFQSDERAMHLTSYRNGTRFIGTSRDPGADGPSLFTLVEKELVPVETGCAREPKNLIELTTKGSVLWAIDEAGFFRLTAEGWFLTEFSEIRDRSGQPRVD